MRIRWFFFFILILMGIAGAAYIQPTTTGIGEATTQQMNASASINDTDARKNATAINLSVTDLQKNSTAINLSIGVQAAASASNGTYANNTGLALGNNDTTDRAYVNKSLVSYTNLNASVNFSLANYSIPTNATVNITLLPTNSFWVNSKNGTLFFKMFNGTSKRVSLN